MLYTYVLDLYYTMKRMKDMKDMKNIYQKSIFMRFMVLIRKQLNLTTDGNGRT